MKIYSIYDKKMLQHRPPIFVNSIIEVTRGIEAALKQPQSLFAQHPTDFEIYYWGEWNEKPTKGEEMFDLLEKPQFEMNITDINIGAVLDDKINS